MEELDVFNKLKEANALSQYGEIFGNNPHKAKQIVAHKAWLQLVRKERPSPAFPYKVGIYIRYFNQTKYDNYLTYHKKLFSDSVSLCPKWSLVDFYVDNGAVAPHMENAENWCRLIDDCMNGKVNLIITQKISNVSSNPMELSICARLLAAQDPPIGIYFISEEVFTLSSYYWEDLHDNEFFPPGWKKLDDNITTGGMLHDCSKR